MGLSRSSEAPRGSAATRGESGPSCRAGRGLPPCAAWWETVRRDSLFRPGRSGPGGHRWLRVPGPGSLDHRGPHVWEGVLRALTSGCATLCLGPRQTSGEHWKSLCSRPCSGAFPSKGRLPRGPGSPWIWEGQGWAAGPLCPAPCPRTRALGGSAARLDSTGQGFGLESSWRHGTGQRARRSDGRPPPPSLGPHPQARIWP